MNVNEFVGAMKFGGARPTLFRVNITNPVNPVADIQLPFLCKATTLPAVTLGVIEAPYFGRKVKLAGDRTYAEWTVTLFEDEDFQVRNALEQWHHAINSPAQNTRAFASASPFLYRSRAQVTQFSKTGQSLRTYEFINIWPLEISTIDLDWGNNDALEEYTVTFQYDYHEVSGLTGTAGT